MELVEGEDLSQRIARGAIPLDEVLPIAKQIADALEAAHEQGIIHRDLKPANIKVRADGTVKVLDFGLAKAMEPTGTSPDFTVADDDDAGHDAGGGRFSGTAAYMSAGAGPGKAVDKRTDVWAFGCVLYEMLAGARAFDGDDVSDTMASVLKSDPDWARLPAVTPPVIRRLLLRCLAKDRKSRIPDMAVARLDIDEACSLPASPSTESVKAPSRLRRVLAMVTVAALSGIAFGAAVWIAVRPSAPAIARLTATPFDAASVGGIPLTRMWRSRPTARGSCTSAPTRVWIRSCSFVPSIGSTHRR